MQTHVNPNQRGLVASIAVCLSIVLLTASPPAIADQGSDGAEAPAASASSTSLQRAASNRRLPVWAADFMAGNVSVSRSRALRQARNFDLIVALRGTYSKHIGAMKDANPNLTVLVYLNGVMAQREQGTHYPRGWYARDRRGNKIRSVGFGNYLMRPDEPGWVKDVGRRCRVYITASGYDGCFIDVLGTAPLNDHYVTSRPVHQKSHRPWTPKAWLAATRQIAAKTRRHVAPSPVLGNGLANGRRYFGDAPSSTILGGLDGAMAEQFVRDAREPATNVHGGKSWRMDVRMLSNTARRGRVALSMTKVWTKATNRQEEAVHRYALATFLLGYQPGHGFFSFRDDRGLTQFRPIWNTSLGDPIGPAVREGRAFLRYFQRGIVVVNPRGSRTTVHLGAGYRKASGRTGNRVVLHGHRAAILTI